MNYAAQYPIGNHQHPCTAKATATAPSIGRVRPLDAKTQRRKRGTEGQTERRATRKFTDGFLSNSFLPKLKAEQSVQACTGTGHIEKDFFKSLSLLAAHYNVQPMPTKEYGYPYNMALALWDIREKLKHSNGNWDNLSLIQYGKKSYIITEERYNTGATLYYIPVLPLFIMLHDKERRGAARLLLSVCCYLYHIADVPYYRQESSYLYWQYEMLSDWVEQDDETEETELYKQELRDAEWVGERMEQKLFNRYNLTYFEQRLTQFTATDEFDLDCRKLAGAALALYREYPEESIFRNAPTREYDPEDEDYGYCEDVIGMEKYISFAADTKGWLYENLATCVNNEFNECTEMDEPTISKTFNGIEISSKNLDFENRLFAIIDDLCELLNNYKQD